MTSLEAPALLSRYPAGRARPFFFASFLTAIALMGSPFASAEKASGEQLAWKYHCMTCHGKQGISNSDRYPNIAGQNAPYLVIRLRQFRSGSEPGNQMNAQAAPLSDAEIEALAAYFSGASS